MADREEMLKEAERLVALLREGQDGYLSWHTSVDETIRGLIRSYYGPAAGVVLQEDIRS
jgi:hypothetical protein